jgi:hypothetical protein
MINQSPPQAANARPADLSTVQGTSALQAQYEQDTQQATVHGVSSPLARLSPRWRLLTRRLRRHA